MTPRREQILELVINEYTENALPVSSAYLCQKHQLPYSSATVRNECVILEQEGYLIQVHSSSGRIPTDLGFRYYVNKLRRKNTVLEHYAQISYHMMKEFHTMTEIHSKLQRLLHSISQESHNLTMGKVSSDVVMSEGIHDFLGQPYFSSMEFVREALSDLEEVKNHIDDIGKMVGKGSYELYIGNENPLEPMRKYSMIVGRCEIDGDDGTIVMIGPKGMSYDKNLALIEYVLNPEDYEDQE